MLSVKILIFLSLQVLAVLGLGNNVLLNVPVLDEDQLNWPQERIQTIEYLLNTLHEVGNVTLIGWQKILNSDGTLKEIRTIELTLLKELPSENVLNLENVDIVEELPVVLGTMQNLSLSTGILLSGSIEQWYRNGSTITSMEVDPDTIQVQLIGTDMMFWQQNITVSSLAPIQSLVNTLKKQSRLPVSVLQWKLDGTLDLQASTIVPELLTTVVDVENATLQMLETAIMATSKGVLLEPDQITTYVANHMKQTVPGYTWIVGEDLLGSMVKPGVSLNVVYDWVDIGMEPISVDILGIAI